MPDFIDGNRAYRQFSDILTTGVRDGTKQIDDQTEEKPTYWIEVMMGGAGWFACMVWDGMGFPEPWEKGDGRYATRKEAMVEARFWAEEEGLELRSVEEEET